MADARLASPRPAKAARLKRRVLVSRVARSADLSSDTAITAWPKLLSSSSSWLFGPERHSKLDTAFQAVLSRALRLWSM
jgi:hypothetical protein